MDSMPKMSKVDGSRQKMVSSTASCQEVIKCMIKEFSGSWASYSALVFFPSYLSRESLASLFIHALGRDSIYFGSFVSVYFLCYRLSNKFLSRQPSFEKQVKLKAIVSGALSSMSILFLDKTSRFNFAVYSSIRALYTLWIKHLKSQDFIKSHDYILRILGIMIMSGQLSYSVFIRPESVERSYRALVESVTGLTSEQIAEMRHRALHGRLNMSGILRMLEYHKTNGKYDPSMEDILSCPTNSIGCQLVHPGEGCINNLASLGMSLFPRLLPFYFALSLVPKVVFSPKRTLNDPLKSLTSIVRSSSRTTTFMVAYAVICKAYVCFKSKMALRDVAYQYWIMGLVGGVAFLIESPSRQVEWFLYYLGKVAFSLERILATDGWQTTAPAASVMVFSASMAVIMSTYEEAPEQLNPLVRSLLNLFLKKIPGK